MKLSVMLFSVLVFDLVPCTRTKGQQVLRINILKYALTV